MMMQTKPLIKQIKRAPIFFLLFIIVSASFKVVSDWRSVGEMRLLEVRVHYLKEKTYKHVDLGENYFITGMEGKLYWKVKNVKEAFLVGMADGDRLMSYYDIFYFLLLDAGLFFLVYRMDEETIFSEQRSLGLKIVFFCIVFYPLISMIDNYYTNQAIQELTRNHFEGQHQYISVGKFQILTYLFIFLYPFVKKAIDLQKEQNLTI